MYNIEIIHLPDLTAVSALGDVEVPKGAVHGWHAAVG